jgi:ATP-dependent Lon protease
MTPYCKAVIRYVASFHDLTPDQIMGRSRRPQISHPRQEVMYMLCKSDMSLPKIGKMMGGRDHTTILFGRRAVVNRSSPERLKQLDEKSYELLVRYSSKSSLYEEPKSLNLPREAVVKTDLDRASLERELADTRRLLEAKKKECQRLTIIANTRSRVASKANHAYRVFDLRQQIDDLKAQLQHEKDERALDRERWFKTRDKTLFLEHQA